MSGRLDRRCEAQLAVLDAVIFFVAAMTISTVLMSYVRTGAESSLDDTGGYSDPADVLEVFMRASIGERLTLLLDTQVCIEPSEEVASCLAAEVAALRQGVAPEAFADLDSLMERILRSISSPALEPHLLVLEPGDPSPKTLMTLGGAPDRGECSYASSCTLGMQGGAECLVELVLCPPAPPELVDV